MPKEPMLHYYTTSREFASREQFIKVKEFAVKQNAWWYAPATPWGDTVSFYARPSELIDFLKRKSISIHDFKIQTADDGYAECKQ